MKKTQRNSKKRRARRRKHYALTAFCVALVVIMLGLSAYVVHYWLNLGRIRSESERYGQLYARNDTRTATASPDPTEALTQAPTASPDPTEAPTQALTASPDPTEAPTLTPTAASNPTEAPAQAPTAAPDPTEAPTPTPTTALDPTEAPTPTPTAEPDPTVPPVESVETVDSQVPPTSGSDAPSQAPGTLPQGEDMPVAPDVPIPTPNADTIVVAMPTPPPVQDSFEGLLAENPDTVGFLEIDPMLSLPVVQRENDNEHYLDHSFSGAKAQEGALFLDGLNRLVPEDDCLIVYGHNMKNRTMFGQLSTYGSVEYMRQHPVVHFDTLYENRSYVVFAAFSASMEPGNKRYFDVRNFVFDETEFDKFVLKLQSRSVYSVPVDVRYGDHLLLLVTCDYANREGRFILALRQLRPDETDASAWAQAMQARKKGS